MVMAQAGIREGYNEQNDFEHFLLRWVEEMWWLWVPRARFQEWVRGFSFELMPKKEKPKCSAFPLHDGAFEFAVGFALFNGLAFIVLGFALAHGKLHLDFAVFPVKRERKEGITLYGGQAEELPYFVLVQQQFADRLRGVVLEIAERVFIDVRVIKKDLVIFDAGKGVSDLAFAGP
jgi:hypothetical protein